MAVKFEFTMEDIDAENLIWAVQDSALRDYEQIMDYTVREDLTKEQKDSYISALKNRKEYMMGLIRKMTNTRVEE